MTEEQFEQFSGTASEAYGRYTIVFIFYLATLLIVSLLIPPPPKITLVSEKEFPGELDVLHNFDQNSFQNLKKYFARSPKWRVSRASLSPDPSTSTPENEQALYVADLRLARPSELYANGGVSTDGSGSPGSPYIGVTVYFSHDEAMAMLRALASSPKELQQVIAGQPFKLRINRNEDSTDPRLESRLVISSKALAVQVVEKSSDMNRDLTKLALADLTKELQELKDATDLEQLLPPNNVKPLEKAEVHLGVESDTGRTYVWGYAHSDVEGELLARRSIDNMSVNQPDDFTATEFVTVSPPGKGVFFGFPAPFGNSRQDVGKPQRVDLYLRPVFGGTEQMIGSVCSTLNEEAMQEISDCE